MKFLCIPSICVEVHSSFWNLLGFSWSIIIFYKWSNVHMFCLNTAAFLPSTPIHFSVNSKVSFHLKRSTRTALTKVTNDLHGAKFNGIFVLILLDSSVPVYSLPFASMSLIFFFLHNWKFLLVFYWLIPPNSKGQYYLRLCPRPSSTPIIFLLPGSCSILHTIYMPMDHKSPSFKLQLSSL